MKQVPVTNVSDDDQLVPVLERVVRAGETVEVDPDVAGRPPKGKPGTDGYDPGEGLLAQPPFAPAKKGATPVEEDGQ